MELSIRTVALMVLMIMIVSLVYIMFEGWFTDTLGNFMSSITFSTP